MKVEIDAHYCKWLQVHNTGVGTLLHEAHLELQKEGMSLPCRCLLLRLESVIWGWRAVQRMVVGCMINFVILYFEENQKCSYASDLHANAAWGWVFGNVFWKASKWL